MIARVGIGPPGGSDTGQMRERGQTRVRHGSDRFDPCLTPIPMATYIIRIARRAGIVILFTIAAVLIEFDFERDTIERLGMPDAHRH